MPYSRDNQGHRSYDIESGMNRTKTAKLKKRSSRRAPPSQELSLEDDSFTEPEAEEFVQAKCEGDSHRPKTTIIQRQPSPKDNHHPKTTITQRQPSPKDNHHPKTTITQRQPSPKDNHHPKTTIARNRKERGAPQQERPNSQEADASDIEHVGKPEAKPGPSGSTLLLAMTRQTVLVPIQYYESNTYLLDCGNMFAAIREMGTIVSTNTKLYKACPNFTTMGLHLYYAHVYYYQILRAREEIGTNDRFDRRSLRIYESIGKPESWPITAPLTGFV